MARVERIYWCWWEPKGVLTELARRKKKWEESKWQDYEYSPRLIDVGVKYYRPGEYVDPIVGKSIKYGVADIIWRERQATRRWEPRQRLNVRRQLWIQKDPNDCWSQYKSQNRLMERGEIYQEFEYEYLDGDRSIWYPVYRSFFLAEPFMLYVRREGDLEKLFLSSGRIDLDAWLSEGEHGMEKAGGKGWTYGTLPCKPPGFLDVANSMVTFGHWRENDPPEEKYRFFGFPI